MKNIINARFLRHPVHPWIYCSIKEPINLLVMDKMFCTSLELWPSGSPSPKYLDNKDNHLQLFLFSSPATILKSRVFTEHNKNNVVT